MGEAGPNLCGGWGQDQPPIPTPVKGSRRDRRGKESRREVAVWEDLALTHRPWNLVYRARNSIGAKLIFSSASEIVLFFVILVFHQLPLELNEAL